MWAERCWDELGRGERHGGDPSSSLADKVKTAAKKIILLQTKSTAKEDLLSHLQWEQIML